MNQTLTKLNPDWEALVKDWARSGLRQEDFCRQSDVSYTTFLKQRGRLIKAGIGLPSGRSGRSGKQKSPASSCGAFIPVSVERPCASPPPEIVVELPMGVVIRFRGFQA